MQVATDAAVKAALACNDHEQAIALNNLAIARVQEYRRACESYLSHLAIRGEEIENSR